MHLPLLPSSLSSDQQKYMNTSKLRKKKATYMLKIKEL